MLRDRITICKKHRALGIEYFAHTVGGVFIWMTEQNFYYYLPLCLPSYADLPGHDMSRKHDGEYGDYGL